MLIDIALFKNSLISNGVTLVSPPSEYQSWINRQPMPEELKEALLSVTIGVDENPYPKTDIGVATWKNWSEIVEENEEFSYIRDAGFIIIGSTGNGDMIAISHKTQLGITGYLSHDELWVWSPPYPNPSDFFLPLAPSLGQFMEMSCDWARCPIDFYGTMAAP